MGLRVSRTKRYITLRLLENTNLLLVHAQHQLWRLAHQAEWAKQSMTESEQKYLLKRVDTLEELTQDLTKLHVHIKRDLDKTT